MRNPPQSLQSDEMKGTGETISTRASITAREMPTLLDLPDVCSNKTRGVTPERVEFENTFEFTSEEELLSEIDEDEWTDRNFGMSANENESSNDESDFSSDEIMSENEDEIQEAFEKSLTAGETLKLAETWKRRYFKKKSTPSENGSDEEWQGTDESEEEYSYEEYDNEDDDESTETEGEMHNLASVFPCEPGVLSPNECKTRNKEDHHNIPQPQVSNASSPFVDYMALKSSETDDTASGGFDSEQFTDSETETKSGGTPEGDADDEDEDQNRNGIHSDDCESPQSICCSMIPTIIINETLTNAPHEDDEAYFVTLQEQSLIAERALESLIIDGHSTSLQKSMVDRTDESHSVQEYTLKKEKIDHETVSQVMLAKDSSFKCLDKHVPDSESEVLGLDHNDKHEDATVKHETFVSKADSYVGDVTTLMKIPGEIEKEPANLMISDVDSLLELSETKNKTKAVQVPAVLESCTSKMMLKLKEQYLLGSANNLNEQKLVTNFSYIPSTSSLGTNLNTLEPAVKSCLQLINEKQKMLSQSTSLTESSNICSRGLTVDIPPLSQSSVLSPSPFSIVSQLPNSSEESQKNCIENCVSPFKIASQDGLQPFTEAEVSNEVRDQSPDFFDDPFTSTMCNFGTSVDSNMSKLSPACLGIVKDDFDVNGKVENIDTSDATIITKVEQFKVTDVTLATEQKENFPEPNVTNEIAKDEIDFEDSLCCSHQDDSLFGFNVDSSKVTMRKKKACQPDVNCQLLEDDHQNAMHEKCNVSVENSSICDVISQDVIIQERCPGSDKFLTSEFLEFIESYDLPLKDQDLQNENENTMIISKKAVNLAVPEDDASLINMSSSSESDHVPSLDENVYDVQHVKAETGSKVAGYAGFSEQMFPFKVYRPKSGMKYFDFTFPSELDNADSLTVESKSECHILASDAESQVHHNEEKISCSNTSNCLDEIPFADDEQAPNLSSLSPDKKDNFFKEQRKLKKSLQRPLSMVEALLCSTPIITSESSKQWMLPDTSIINPGVFSTPRTMKEAVDDLRQIRTVEREKARQEARERARLKSDEELGLRKIDYPVLKKRHQKIDGKLGFNFEEEIGPCAFLSNDDNYCPEEIQINTLCKQQLPCIHSSSPDSEVFEQDIEIASSSRTAMLKNISDEQGEVNKKEVTDLHPNSPDDTNSISISSNPPSTNEITMSESSTSMTSKTDHPSSYLEPDISVDEVDFSVPVESGKVAVLQSNSKKNTHKRKRFLSLFSNFGKVKDKLDKKNKEKSSTSTSSSSSPHDASVTESPRENALLTFDASQLKHDSIPKECRFPKLHLSKSKEKLKEKDCLLKSVKVMCSSPQSSCSTTKLNDAESRSPSITHSLQSGDIILDRHTLIASMASISRQIPQLEKNENGVAPDGNIVLRESQGSLVNDSKKPKELTEDRKKKFQKIAQKVYRQQEQKRLRMAQEIQRQLEELEVKQRDMEIKGVQVEKALHGEGDLSSNEEGKLMQQWFQLIHAKNLLVRQEQELMVKAKELELEDRHSRLQHTLHLLMTVEDLKKTPSEIEEEGHILTEMLEIVEQRDNLVALLEKNRVIQQEEDKDLELTMQAKGMNLLLALPI